MKRVLSILFAAGVALFATAQAGTVYNYTKTNLNQKSDVGQIEFLSISYDTDEKLSFKATLGNSPTAAANGGWFVLSPGNNPKGIVNELAIFYMDFTGGDIYVYKYNGANSTASYKVAGSFITKYANVLDVTGDANGLMVSFDDLDISAIAANTFGPEWTGASFEDNIGIWLHFSAFDKFKVKHGKIKYLKTGPQTWYDVANHTTTKVSEPLGFALAGLFLAAGVVVARRRRQSVQPMMAAAAA